MADPIIRERQTVARVQHPTLGEGRAIHRNGPAFFIADSGEVVEFTRMGLGGASSGPPPRSWLVGHLPDGERVDLEQYGRDHGKAHERIVTEDGRPGWLVWWFDDFKTWCNVFEPDDGGEPVKFAANYAHVGHPKDKKKTKLPAARAHFMTLGRGTFAFVYSREGDTPKAAAEKQSKQLDLLRDLAKREGAST